MTGGLTLGDLLTTFAEELMVLFAVAPEDETTRLRVKDMSIELPAHLFVTTLTKDGGPRIVVWTTSPRDTSGTALGRIRMSVVTGPDP